MEEQQQERVRVPRQGEIMGLVLELLGGDRFRVDCNDGKVRICRIPGKLRKKVWIRPNDVVVVEPWKIQGDKRGDLVWRYTGTQVSWLKKQGYMKQ
ncbi:MAG: translation initiation factor eIF-1A [Candidatus Aenigmarchaeota archaeon]|nr:translation initiation factor eIF-1A [Candidatus Aenigmarchaeota archaeon]